MTIIACARCGHQVTKAMLFMNDIDGAGTGACVDKLEAAKRDAITRTRAWMNRISGSTDTWRHRKKQRVSNYKVGWSLEIVLSHRGRLSRFLKNV